MMQSRESEMQRIPWGDPNIVAKGNWSSVFDHFPDLFLLYPASFSISRRV